VARATAIEPRQTPIIRPTAESLEGTDSTVLAELMLEIMLPRVAPRRFIEGEAATRSTICVSFRERSHGEGFVIEKVI